MDYKEYKNRIFERLNSAADDFFTIGFYLRKIHEGELYKEDGYKNIWDFAKSEYGLSISSASRFMAINSRFSLDGAGEVMQQKFVGMGVSKLQEMLSLPDEDLEKVTRETTVKEIREMKAARITEPDPEPLSALGFPKTVRPEGSLLDTPGCGGGKYSCFLCSRECEIRQEPRTCRTAPMSNRFPCTVVNNDVVKRRMGYSLYRDQCQILHPELAPVTEGDNEPDPCCLNCPADIRRCCVCCCDVAKQQMADEKKQKAAEERQKERRIEEQREYPSDPLLRKAYDKLGIDINDNITAKNLKEAYRDRVCMHKGFHCQGSARGLRINNCKELTWVQVAKEFLRIQENIRPATYVVPQKEPEHQDIIDAEFVEVEDVKKTEAAPEPASGPDKGSTANQGTDKPEPRTSQ